MIKFKNIIIALLITSSTLFSSVIVGEDIKQFSLKDQFDKTHKIESETKILIFAFSKDIGHKVNEFFEKESPNYLLEKNAKFIINLSSAPSIIRSFFIIPKLEKYKYPVLIIEDEEIIKNYLNEKNIDKIMVVSLENMKVKGVDFFEKVKGLKEFLEK